MYTRKILTDINPKLSRNAAHEKRHRQYAECATQRVLYQRAIRANHLAQYNRFYK